MTTPTKTPLSDALQKKHTRHGSWAQSNEAMDDMLSSHKKLEKELAEANRILKNVKESAVVLTEAGIDALRERDEAKKELVAAQAEVEKLKKQLTRTGKIAEKIADEWVSADFFDEHQFIKLRSELSQITTNLDPNDKPE
jgi:chromosome segregation ATPase